MINKNIRYKIFEKADDVPVEEWKKLSKKKSITLSYEFWKAIECSNIPQIQKIKYVVFYINDSEAVAWAPFYVVRTDIAFLSKGIIRTSLAKIRRLIPCFMTMKMLECGSPVTMTSPPFLVSEKFPQNIFIKHLRKFLLWQSLRQLSFIFVIRDFDKKDSFHKSYKYLFRDLGFIWANNLPNTYLPLHWSSIDEYYQSMRSHYRHKLQKHLKKNSNEKVKYTIINDFAALSEVLIKQWQVIHDNAKELEREVITSEFYENISNRMDTFSSIIYFTKDDKPCAHVLLLHDNDMLRWMYIGREESLKDSMYFYIIDKIISYGIDNGFKMIELGLTTYPIKQDFGGQLIQNNIAISFVFPIFNFMVSLVWNLFNKPAKYTKRRVFKE